MITKIHAQVRTCEAVERIRAAAQLKIDTYFTNRSQDKESAAMATIFEAIDAAVKYACDKGYSSYSVICASFGDDEKVARRRCCIAHALLRELGYAVSFSCSSHWKNEQLTVSWE